MAEIILFVDSEYGGLHTHMFATTNDFTKLKLTGTGTGLSNNNTWNDVVSSFVIVSGTWRFYKDVGPQSAFVGPNGEPIELGPQSPGTTDQSGNTLPGHFPVLPAGFENDALSAIELVHA